MAHIDIVLQKRYSSYLKYWLTKMAPNINGTSKKWHLTTYITGFSWNITPLLIESTPLKLSAGDRVIWISLWSGKNSILKSHDHECESCNTAQKMKFSLRISSVNVTKSAGNYRFDNIYWRNPLWKTSFFVQCKKYKNCLLRITQLSPWQITSRHFLHF